VTARELLEVIQAELGGLLVEHQVGAAGSVIIGSAEWRAGVRASLQLIELVAAERGVIE
jgi:hypothetical protein